MSEPGLASVWRPDVLAGLAMSGLLLPEAVAYAGIAGLPPHAGLIGLLFGLTIYGLIGSSRFAVVAATSSSAAVLGAATLSLAAGQAGHRLALASGLVILTGIAFIVAGLARFGSVSNFISKPVLRGFAFGLGLSIVLRQLAKIAGIHPPTTDMLSFAWHLLEQLAQWNPWGLGLGLSSLIVLRWAERARQWPVALALIAASIAVSQFFELGAKGVELVGSIKLASITPGLPSLAQSDWLKLGELAFAVVLLLFAESYGAIRSLALKHGDTVAPNRDLFALGAANLASGLFGGTPVGAGYSASSANEAAGAQSRRSAWVAAVCIVLMMAFALPWVELTPEPVLAAVVINALWHALSLDAFRPYFRWRRDRLVVIGAAAAVVLLGVLYGLLAGIGVSLLMTLRDLSMPRVSELGRQREGHDFLSLAAHTDARLTPGILVLRPEAPLYFGNVDAMLADVMARLQKSEQTALVLSLEESPDLDGTCIEVLQGFVNELRSRGIALVLARLKDNALAVLSMTDGFHADELDGGSVSDAVSRLLARPAVAAPMTS
ncbi:SulP family inorganic anion transporter [Roseateles oligotrophus]|uniref:STAS domain-containing protein n=1 Tax=Roseateles oligotrophus TaxID=1769250 RepID=A0ABT2YCV5_9BURK|nr:SulP family inorganic anion transporter [Roseateles oligotrophus]MCV2367873.1 STAS domain-containing protein [Roseateles oligotrophus]